MFEHPIWNFMLNIILLYIHVILMQETTMNLCRFLYYRNYLFIFYMKKLIIPLIVNKILTYVERIVRWYFLQFKIPEICWNLISTYFRINSSMLFFKKYIWKWSLNFMFLHGIYIIMNMEDVYKNLIHFRNISLNLTLIHEIEVHKRNRMKKKQT